MESLLGPLLPLFERERAASNAVAVGILVHTAGSTYRKAGALMLIAANGEYAGLLSGGCLEGDLGHHARSVIDTGVPQTVMYDMRGGDDLIWGLGLGCEGAMHVLLLRAGPAENWEPMTHLAASLAGYRPASVGIIVESEHSGLQVGTLALPGQRPRSPAGAVLEQAAASMLEQPGVAAVLDEAARSGRPGSFEATGPRWKLFALPLTRPPQLLLLGAGPDAAPVVDFAARLNWRVTVVDHREAYANAEHFPTAHRVVLARPDELLNVLDPEHFSAAVVMSHHLPSDLEYLRALAGTGIPYVGLLGPAVRRERLLADLGGDAEKLRSRLRAPVGLALGGRSPESIALAIVAEIHAFVYEATPTAARAA